MKDNASMRMEYKIELFNAKTGERKAEYKSHNIVTNNGLKEYLDMHPSGGLSTIREWAQYCVVGTGDSTPQATDEYLDSEIEDSQVWRYSYDGYGYSDLQTTLSQGIDDEVQTISVTDVSDFAESGTVLIEEEEITYEGRTDTQLTGCTRGANETSATSHTQGQTVESLDYYYKIVYSFDEDQGNGDIREIGIKRFSGDSDKLVIRLLTRDENGNPIAIPKTDQETMTITAYIYIGF